MTAIQMDIPTDTTHLAIILERWYDKTVRFQQSFGRQGWKLTPYRSDENGFNYTHHGHEISLVHLGLDKSAAKSLELCLGRST